MTDPSAAETDYITRLLAEFPPDDERDHAETEPGQPGHDLSWIEARSRGGSAMTDQTPRTAETGGFLARFRRAWFRCPYCGEDQRSEACCGIRYYADRTEIPEGSDD